MCSAMVAGEYVCAFCCGFVWCCMILSGACCVDASEAVRFVGLWI